MISAQISVYPLRQAHLTPAVQRLQAALAARSLHVESGPMSTLARGEPDAVFAALREAFTEVARDGQLVMVVTLSNACPA